MANEEQEEHEWELPVVWSRDALPNLDVSFTGTARTNLRGDKPALAMLIQLLVH